MPQESVICVIQPVYANCIYYCNYAVSTFRKSENKLSMKTKLNATERLKTSCILKLAVALGVSKIKI